MIHDVHKYLFVGVKEEMDLFFEKAQSKGILEFIPSEQGKYLVFPQLVEQISAAIRILKKEGKAKKVDFAPEREAEELSAAILRLKKEQLERLEAKRLLIQEINLARPFGSFSMEEVRQIEVQGQRKVQFFCSRKKEDQEDLIEIAHAHDLFYYIAITPRGRPLQNGLVEIHLRDHYMALEHELEVLEVGIAQRHERLLELTPYIEFLQKALAEHLSENYLLFAKEMVDEHFEGKLFSIEGWVPVNQFKKLHLLLKGMKVHAEQIAIEKTDQVPTYMENKGLAACGEDLVHIYDTPDTSDKDPSGWVLWAFTLFFGMIVADAGYGLIYLLISLILRLKIKDPSAGAKRAMKLFTMLSCGCILWGSLSASYFGMSLSQENPLERYSPIGQLVEAKAAYHMKQKDDVYDFWVAEYPSLSSITEPRLFLDSATKTIEKQKVYPLIEEFKDNLLLELSLLVGVIHITLSLLRMAWRAPSGLGWIAFMIGGYLFFPKELNATSLIHILGLVSKQQGFAIGIQLLWGGIAFALLTALIQHRWRGFEELTKSIQVFADVLSYLRLYALALAGMIMAQTFNEISQKFGPLVLIIGHTTNMGLGIMGGVIHGLRLNFLEWYHYSFSGGGRRFKPLKILK